MTSKKSANDYFKKIVAALERENVEELVYSRRDYYDTMPADPSFPVDTEDRDQQTAALTKLATTFWDNADIEKELAEFPESHFPELQDWQKKLQTVVSEKQLLEAVFIKYHKAPETTLSFFRKFYTGSDREATQIRKEYLLKLNSNKKLLKWHSKLYKALQKTAPKSAEFTKVEAPIMKKMSSFKLYKSSAGDNSGNIGCLIFIIIWMLIRFIGAVL